MFSAFFIKGNNFYDFLFAFLKKEVRSACTTLQSHQYFNVYNKNKMATNKTSRKRKAYSIMEKLKIETNSAKRNKQRELRNWVYWVFLSQL